jgi:hypothetical protein
VFSPFKSDQIFTLKQNTLHAGKKAQINNSPEIIANYLIDWLEVIAQPLKELKMMNI